jgi:hypothetical protein
MGLVSALIKKKLAGLSRTRRLAPRHGIPRHGDSHHPCARPPAPTSRRSSPSSASWPSTKSSRTRPSPRGRPCSNATVRRAPRAPKCSSPRSMAHPPASPCSSTTSRPSSASRACIWKTCSCARLPRPGLGKRLMVHLAQPGGGARLRPLRMVGAGLERARDRFLPQPRCGRHGRMDRAAGQRRGAAGAGDAGRKRTMTCASGKLMAS